MVRQQSYPEVAPGKGDGAEPGDSIAASAVAGFRHTLLSPATTAMFDLLSDAKHHANVALIKVGAAAALADDFEAALAFGKRVRRQYWGADDLLDDTTVAATGAAEIARNGLYTAVRSGRLIRDGDRHRMFADVAEQWRAERGELITTIPAGLEIAGLPEWEGWLFAPLTERDMVRFNSDDMQVSTLRAHLRRKLGNGVVVTGNGVDLIRAVCPNGAKAKAEIERFCSRHGTTVRSLRVTRGVRRRDTSKLPPGFLDGIVLAYGSMAQRVLSRQRNRLLDVMPAADADDIAQFANLLVLEAATRYDDGKGVPFEAFVIGSIPQELSNLQRERWGRGGADAELWWRRATTAFYAEHGHEPTAAELAEYTGVEPKDVLERQRLAADIARVRAARSTDVLDRDVLEHVSVPAGAEDGSAVTAERIVLGEQAQTELSAALTSAGVAVSPLGWAAVYLQTWCASSAPTIAAALGAHERQVKESALKVCAAMRQYIDDDSD